MEYSDFPNKKEVGKMEASTNLRMVNATMDRMGALQPGRPSPMIPLECYLIILAWRRGHVCVFPETATSLVWVPERHIRQYGGDHPTIQMPVTD